MRTERDRWAQAIRTARSRRCWTQRRLANVLNDRAAADKRILNVRQSDVSDWENAKRIPPDDVRAELIRTLSIDPRDVVPEWIRPLLKTKTAA